MSILPILIYLAGPIDSVGQEEAQGWREEIAHGAPEAIAFFSPAHAFMDSPNKVNAAAVDFANRQIINVCDGVLAYQPYGPTFGTVREIEFARRCSTPVVLAGAVEPSLMVYDLEVFPAGKLDAGLNRLLEIVGDERKAHRGIQAMILGRMEPGDPDA